MSLAWHRHSGSVFSLKADSSRMISRFLMLALYPHRTGSPLTRPPHCILFGSGLNHRGLTSQTTHTLRQTERRKTVSVVEVGKEDREQRFFFHTRRQSKSSSKKNQKLNSDVETKKHFRSWPEVTSMTSGEVHGRNVLAGLNLLNP